MTTAVFVELVLATGGAFVDAGVVGYYKGKKFYQGDTVLDEIVETEYNFILQLTHPQG